eukprot:snap_masked-scaffold_11-processed-gene-5.31-mRNA-1 protein AED:1.00 eAED:1.00 QI:0/0/0/0/1/1/2/0/70
MNEERKNEILDLRLCSEIKLNYEKCFRTWSSSETQRLHRDDPCIHLFESYKNCVEQELRSLNFDLSRSSD